MAVLALRRRNRFRRTTGRFPNRSISIICAIECHYLSRSFANFRRFVTGPDSVPFRFHNGRFLFAYNTIFSVLINERRLTVPSLPVNNRKWVARRFSFTHKVHLFDSRLPSDYFAGGSATEKLRASLQNLRKSRMLRPPHPRGWRGVG